MKAALRSLRRLFRFAVKRKMLEESSVEAGNLNSRLRDTQPSPGRNVRECMSKKGGGKGAPSI